MNDAEKAEVVENIMDKLDKGRDTWIKRMKEDFERRNKKPGELTALENTMNEIDKEMYAYLHRNDHPTKDNFEM